MNASDLAPSRRSQADGVRAARILVEGATCWRIPTASRATPLIDGAAYFDALRAALDAARERVFIIGWDIRSDITLDPEGSHRPLADHLRDLVRRRRGLRVHILVWDWVLLYSLDRQLFPQYRFERAFEPRLRMVMDGNHPPGGCHHEKLVVVDGGLAFCGGIDLTKGRWDRPAHRASEPARGTDGDAPLPPFHDLMLMVEGEAAASLDELARERWRRATGMRLDPPGRQGPSPWPDGMPAWFEHVPVAIARTRPAWGRQVAVREIEALIHEAIRAAQRTIYIESQYFTVDSIGKAIEDQLAAERGPEVVIIGPDRCEGFVETAVMDVGRARLVDRLRTADRHGRARIVCATVEDDGQRAPINVHAKLLIVDDRLLMIGSANFANRSMGLDTECDLAIEADEPSRARAVARTRTALLAEHLGVSGATLEQTVEDRGSLVAAIDALNGGPRRLERLEIRSLELPEELEEGAALADPGEPITSRLIEERLVPPSRRRRLARILARSALTVAGLGALALLLRSGMTGEGGSIGALLQTVEAYRYHPLGLLVAIAVFVAGSLAFVPVNLMIAATAAAFGPVSGLVCALAGSFAAAAALFALGRGLGRDLLRRLAGRRMNAVNRRLAQHGVMAVVMLRVVPIAPFSVVNLIAGSSEVRGRDFLLGTLLGMTPGIVVMTIFGDRLGAWLRNPDVENLWFLVAAVVIALGLLWALRQWSGRRSGAWPSHAGRDL